MSFFGLNDSHNDDSGYGLTEAELNFAISSLKVKEFKEVFLDVIPSNEENIIKFNNVKVEFNNKHQRGWCDIKASVTGFDDEIVGLNSLDDKEEFTPEREEFYGLIRNHVIENGLTVTSLEYAQDEVVSKVSDKVKKLYKNGRVKYCAESANNNILLALSRWNEDISDIPSAYSKYEENKQGKKDFNAYQKGKQLARRLNTLPKTIGNVAYVFWQYKKYNEFFSSSSYAVKYVNKGFADCTSQKEIEVKLFDFLKMMDSL